MSNSTQKRLTPISAKIIKKLNTIELKVNRISQEVPKITAKKEKKSSMGMFSNLKLEPEKVTEWLQLLNNPMVQELIQKYTVSTSKKRRR